QLAKLVGIADTKFEAVTRTRRGERNPQRKRIDAEHVAGRTGEPCDMFGEQPGAAPDVEHVLGGGDRELLDQPLACDELALRADAIVVARKRLVVELKRWSGDVSHYGSGCSCASHFSRPRLRRP